MKISDSKPEDREYIGSNCITRYWIWNEEHDCISYAMITPIEKSEARFLNLEQEE